MLNTDLGKILFESISNIYSEYFQINYSEYTVEYFMIQSFLKYIWNRCIMKNIPKFLKKSIQNTVHEYFHKKYLQIIGNT